MSVINHILHEIGTPEHLLHKQQLSLGIIPVHQCGTDVLYTNAHHKGMDIYRDQIFTRLPSVMRVTIRPLSTLSSSNYHVY